MVEEPQPVVAITPDEFRHTRITVSLKASYPVSLGIDKFFLTPFASISEDIVEGADVQREALRLLAKLRPAYGMVLLQEYLDAVGIAQGKTIPEIVRSMCGDPTPGAGEPQPTVSVGVSADSLSGAPAGS